jgi:hypothetical protein
MSKGDPSKPKDQEFIMKTTLKATMLGALSLIVPALLAAPAAADARNPSSLLLFPQFKHAAVQQPGQFPSVNTLITVSNTHPTLPAFVHFVFVDARGTQPNPCTHFNDQTRRIEPCGNISFLTSPFSGTAEREGFAYAFAVDRAAPPWTPVSFNYLIGDAMIVDGVSAATAGIVSNYSVQPATFRAVNESTNTAIGTAGIAPLPLLNGTMYAKAPGRLLIPRFMGQDTGATPTFESELVLLNLAGSGVAPTANSLSTIVDFLVFNDNEEAFSAQFEFRCWSRVSLLQINGIFSETFLSSFTNDNPQELTLGGGNFKETGWIYLEGNVSSSTTADILSPPIYGFLIERTSATEVTAELPFLVGEKNGRIVP